MRHLRTRLALFFNIKSSAALDQAEDPREVLDYAYSQQQLHLRSIKRGLVDLAAARRQLEMQADRLRARAARLEDQARRAVRSGREDLARAALGRKQALLADLRRLDEQRAAIAADEERLRKAEEQFASRVERFRLHRTVASARYAAAEAQVGVGEAIAGVLGDEDAELSIAVERSEDRIERLAARASAVSALVEETEAAPPVGVEPFETELDELEARQAVEAELAALKRQLDVEAEAAPEEQVDE
jgi:phage shock protein A